MKKKSNVVIDFLNEMALPCVGVKERGRANSNCALLLWVSREWSTLFQNETTKFDSDKENIERIYNDYV